MSVMNTHTEAEAAPKSRREILEEAIPFVFAAPLWGPPAIFLLGPLLILVLLLIPPAAFLITLGLVAVVGAALLAALGALIASPYLLVRHLRARHAEREQEQEPEPERSAWAPAPAPAAAGVGSLRTTFASHPDIQLVPVATRR